MKKSFIIFLILIFIPLSSMVYASPGKTDAKGCHTEKATGNYHCHTAPTVKQARTLARAVAPVTVKAISKNFNCADFSSQSEAQLMFEKSGGKLNDVFGLDKDKDGIACEAI